MRALVLLTVLFSLPSAHAFNWRRCKTIFEKARPYKSKETNLFHITTGQTSQNTTQSSIEASSSTTSYLSSFGKCKAIGAAETRRLYFVAATGRELQWQLAEGHGEHVAALSDLYGCAAWLRPEFGRVLKAHHSKIFSAVEPDAGDVTASITETVKGVALLKNHCQLELI